MGRITSPRWLLLAILLVVVARGWSVAPPPRMTPAQVKRLQESNRLFGQANALLEQEKKVEAIEVIRRGLKIQREVFGQVPRSRCNWLEVLAELLEEREDWLEAEKARVEILGVLRSALGERHWQVVDARWKLRDAKGRPAMTALERKQLAQAVALNTQVVRLAKAGKAAQAVAACRVALKIRKEVLGEKHPDYAQSLNNLAFLYQAMGDHKQALPLCLQAIKVRKEVLGEKHPDYATSLNDLAFLYQAMGDHKQALPLCLQAMKIRKEVLGKMHPNYATSLHDLASLYQAMGNYKQALPLYLQAMKIYKEAIGEKHPSYATSLNNLAALCKAMGDHKQALPLYLQAMKTYKEVLGEKHPSYAVSLNNLALLYRDMGDYKQALPLFLEAMKLFKEVLGEKQSSYVASLHNLAALYQALKKEEEAVRLSDLALKITLANLRDSASVQSQRQQLAASEALRPLLNLRLSLVEGTASVYQHVLACKGAVFLLQQERHLFARLLADARPEVRHTVEELRQTTCALASLALAPVDPRTVAVRREQMEKLTREQEDLEGKLSRLADDFRQTRRQEQLGVETLQQALPAGVALVDFLFYTHHDHTQTDEGKRYQRRLTAFVLLKGKAVVRLDLGLASAVEEAVRDWRLSILRRGKGGLAAQKLRKNLWLPVEKHLGGAKVVLISPDEALAGLPFAALPGSKPGAFLLEDVALAVAPVPRALPSLLAPAPKGSRLKPSLLVVGDVDFDSAEVAVASAGDRSPPRGGLKGWGRLKNTRAEASDVKDSFSRLFKGGGRHRPARGRGAQESSA